MWFWHKEERTQKYTLHDQDPRGQISYDKGAKKIQRGKGSLFNKWCWENWLSTCKRMNFDPYLAPYMKINSKWFKDINTRHKAIKFLGENTGQNLHKIGFGNAFLYMTLKVTTKIVYKLNFMKIFKILCIKWYPQSKKATNRMRENTCRSYTW